MADGRLIATGLKGIQQQLYAIDGDRADLLPGLPGTYAGVDAGLHTRSLLVKYSTLTTPVQVFLAANPAQPDQAKPISGFNPLFTQRAQPEWKTFQWKADDGATVEGILIYPPHRMGEKNLRMLTLIHGGPAEADGNYFEADWDAWETSLRPTAGWSSALTIVDRAAMATISCCRLLLTWSPGPARTYWKGSTHW